MKIFTLLIVMTMGTAHADATSDLAKHFSEQDDDHQESAQETPKEPIMNKYRGCGVKPFRQLQAGCRLVCIDNEWTSFCD